MLCTGYVSSSRPSSLRTSAMRQPNTLIPITWRRSDTQTTTCGRESFCVVTVGLYLITLQPDKRGFLIKESTIQSAKYMHPTLIDHISAKIKDIRLNLSQDGALTKALQLYNDYWPKHNTKFFHKMTQSL